MWSCDTGWRLPFSTPPPHFSAFATRIETRESPTSIKLYTISTEQHLDFHSNSSIKYFKCQLSSHMKSTHLKTSKSASFHPRLDKTIKQSWKENWDILCLVLQSLPILPTKPRQLSRCIAMIDVSRKSPSSQRPAQPSSQLHPMVSAHGPGVEPSKMPKEITFSIFARSTT